MINGNGGKCKSTANKYALSATDLPGEHLALMESGNTLIHSAGIINTQFLHDMDAAIRLLLLLAMSSSRI